MCYLHIGQRYSMVLFLLGSLEEGDDTEMAHLSIQSVGFVLCVHLCIWRSVSSNKMTVGIAACLQVTGFDMSCCPNSCACAAFVTSGATEWWVVALVPPKIFLTTNDVLHVYSITWWPCILPVPYWTLYWFLHRLLKPCRQWFTVC